MRGQFVARASTARRTTCESSATIAAVPYQELSREWREISTCILTAWLNSAKKQGFSQPRPHGETWSSQSARWKSGREAYRVFHSKWNKTRSPWLYESGNSVFAIRIYLSALILTFLVVAVMTRGIGVLEATVVVCPLLYMILDIREELEALRSLEARVLSLSR